ncbi:MAG: hypothetical protein V3W41_09315 [Planctomycetota bacterium]
MQVPKPSACWDVDGAEAVLSQLWPVQRPLARVEITSEATLSATPERGDLKFSLDDDGLLRLQTTDSRPVSLRVVATTKTETKFVAQERGAEIRLDANGGFGVWPSSASMRRDAKGLDRDLVFDLVEGEELFVQALPSKRPDPRFLGWRIAHEGQPRPFPRAAYPNNERLKECLAHAELFAWHAYFWRGLSLGERLQAKARPWRRSSWMTAFHEPELKEEFERVKDGVKQSGRPFVLYISPRYSRAPNLAEEMKRIVVEYGADGFYLDGLALDIREARAQMVAARAAVGNDGLLYLNASDRPYTNAGMRCPFVEGLADFCLRGANGKSGLDRESFLRFGVSGWHTTSTIGLWCHYGSRGLPFPYDRAPSNADIDAALEAHVRLWRRSHWGVSALARFDARYEPGLAVLAEREKRALATEN